MASALRVVGALIAVLVGGVGHPGGAARCGGGAAGGCALAGFVYLAHQTPAGTVAFRCRSEWVRAATVAATVIAACYVLAGLVVLLGPSAPVLVLLVAGAAIAWRVHAGRNRIADSDDERGHHQRGAPRPALRVVPAVPAPATLAEVPTAELCRAWRVSYLTVATTRDPDVREQVATARRHNLDELERRDPASFWRWIDSGARAASDPARYIPCGGIPGDGIIGDGNPGGNAKNTHDGEAAA